MRVVIHGPPAVGKSTVAEQLCDYYKLHHIHVKNVIAEGIDRMVSFVSPQCAIRLSWCCLSSTGHSFNNQVGSTRTQRQEWMSGYVPAAIVALARAGDFDDMAL